jgi:hypothetical protein
MNPGMGRLIRPLFAMVLALFARPAPVSRIATPESPPGAGVDAGWYSPRAEDFRAHYDRDPANAARQTWDQYWGWIKAFYSGNLLAKGWSDRGRWLVEGVRSEVERERLQARLNALGRDIGAEWAKDYDVRKLTSADLMTWGKMLEQAREEDVGDGAAFHRAIDAIDRARRTHLGGGTGSPR